MGIEVDRIVVAVEKDIMRSVVVDDLLETGMSYPVFGKKSC